MDFDLEDLDEVLVAARCWYGQCIKNPGRDFTRSEVREEMKPLLDAINRIQNKIWELQRQAT